MVSLAPFLTELVYSAGAGDRLVGAVAFSDYPEAAARLPQVGDFKRLDLEVLLALQPDLVLAADPEVIVAGGMDDSRPAWLDQWRQWPQLRAMRNGHLYYIPADLIHRHSPRLLDGAQRMCELLERVRQSRE